MYQTDHNFLILTVQFFFYYQKQVNSFHFKLLKVQSILSKKKIFKVKTTNFLILTVLPKPTSHSLFFSVSSPQLLTDSALSLLPLSLRSLPVSEHLCSFSTRADSSIRWAIEQSKEATTRARPRISDLRHSSQSSANRFPGGQCGSTVGSGIRGGFSGLAGFGV